MSNCSNIPSLQGIVNLGMAIAKKDPASAFNAAFQAFDGLRSIDLTIMALNDIITEIAKFVYTVRNVNEDLDST